MNTTKVKRIGPGATVGIYAPSEPIVESRRPRFEKGVEILERQGFKVTLGAHVFSKTGYTAGSIEERVSDIHCLLRDDSVDILLAAWGGKSCNQLVGHLDYSLISAARKPIMGFSDACVIANCITIETGMVTFYGPNVVGKLNESCHANLAILRESWRSRNFLCEDGPGQGAVLSTGTTCGRLFGGNLSTFVLGVLCGRTPLDAFDGAIFFWEDMSTPQVVNQHLTAIQNAGLFERISGMVIGKLISIEEKHWKQVDLLYDLGTFLRPYTFPVLYMPVFGHANLQNPIIPIGAMARLDVERAGLFLEEEVWE